MIGAIPQSAKPWLLGTVTSGIFIILTLVAQYWLVSQMFSADFLQQAHWVVMAIVALLLGRFVTIIWHRTLGAGTSAEVKQTIRAQLLEKLAKLRPYELTPELRGKLNYLLGEGVEVLDLYWGLFVPQFFIGLLGPLLVCVFIAFIDPLSGLVLLLMIPVIPAILMLVFKRFASVSATYKHNLALLTELFTQSLYGLPVLKLYQHSKVWGGTIEQHGAKLRRSTMSLLKTNQLVILLVDLLFSLGTIIAASLLAITRYQSGLIEASTAAFIILASVELIRPLSLMGAFFFAGALGREVQDDVKTILLMRENNPIQAIDSGSEVVLDVQSLCFGYDNKTPLFEQLNLRVNKGELVVVCGQSGCGKSTLFKLIRGQLAPDSGVIASQATGYLQQSPYIFNGSVETNCLIADSHASADDINAALKSSVLEPLGANSEYLLYQLGESGEHISGGQAARISISRAFLSHKPLLLIDEPTRQLDECTERKVIEALHQLKQNAGVLVISHSPQLIAQADRIIDLTRVSTEGKLQLKEVVA